MVMQTCMRLIHTSQDAEEQAVGMLFALKLQLDSEFAREVARDASKYLHEQKVDFEENELVRTLTQPLRQYADTYETCRNPKECTVCLDNLCNLILIPCGHVSLCDDCFNDLGGVGQPCVACREPVENIMTLGEFLKAERMHSKQQMFQL